MFRRLFGFPERREMPPRIDGEVISLIRFPPREVFVAIYTIVVSLLLLLVFLFINHDRALLAMSIVCALAAVAPSGLAVVFIVFKPRLILGWDRIQCASFPMWIDWEIKFQDIAEIELVSKRGIRFIGIKFTDAASLHPSWQCPALRKSRQYNQKKWGYDLCLYCQEMHERPEAVFEAILRCYHRFGETQELKSCDS